MLLHQSSRDLPCFFQRLFGRLRQAEFLRSSLWGSIGVSGILAFVWSRPFFPWSMQWSVCIVSGKSFFQGVCFLCKSCPSGSGLCACNCVGLMEGFSVRLMATSAGCSWTKWCLQLFIFPEDQFPLVWSDWLACFWWEPQILFFVAKF